MLACSLAVGHVFGEAIEGNTDFDVDRLQLKQLALGSFGLGDCFDSRAEQGGEIGLEFPTEC